MPAQQKTDKDLKQRVILAQTHADPDVRALAEAVLELWAHAERTDQRLERAEADGE